MRWLNRISSLVLAGFSILIFVSSLELGIGTFGEPGPGLMGFLASMLLFFLSLTIFVKEMRKSGMPAVEGAEQPHIGWENLTKPLTLAIALCFYTFALGTLGYLLSTTLLMFLMLFIYSPRKWYVHLVLAIVIVNASYLVFYKWLGVLLPAGILRMVW